MNLEISYPFKPFIVTQDWGNLNPAYETQFHDPNFKRHNGIDAVTRTYWGGKLLTEFLVYCPVKDFVVYNVDYQPNGGGNEIWLKSKQPLQMFERNCYAFIILCHAKKVLVPIGYEPALGELLMIADNTGFSTGLHTHMGVYRCDQYGNKLDQNESTGSFDPVLFFTEKYATDQASTSTLITSGLRYLKYLTS